MRLVSVKELKERDEDAIDWRQVPHQFYSVMFRDPDVNENQDVEVIKHENSLLLNVETINAQPNCFSRKSDAQKAKRLIMAVLNHKNVKVVQ